MAQIPSTACAHTHRVYASMPRNGVRPSSDTMFIIVKSCKEAGRLDLARAYAKEFVANGVRARPSAAAMLEDKGPGDSSHVGHPEQAPDNSNQMQDSPGKATDAQQNMFDHVQDSNESERK